MVVRCQGGRYRAERSAALPPVRWLNGAKSRPHEPHPEMLTALGRVEFDLERGPGRLRADAAQDPPPARYGEMTTGQPRPDRASQTVLSASW